MPIFDQGYHHWHGQRGGLGMRWWAIARRGVAVEQRRTLTRLICLLGFFPSLLLIVMLALWGLAEDRTGPMGWFLQIFGPDVQANPKAFRTVVWTICYQFYFVGQLYYCMVLVALVGPRLISQDLRFNAIPLYFSRPLRRIDYFLGKWGVIAVFLGMVAIVPPVFAWLCGIAFSLDVTMLRDTWRTGLAVLGYGLIITVSAGTLMLAFSALSRRSGYVVIMWFGFWLVTLVTAASLADSFPAKKWCPVLGYSLNLQRVGNRLLDTRAAWQKLQDLADEKAAVRSAPAGFPAPGPGTRSEASDLLQYAGEDYPWYWSGAILAGLFGLSTAVLRFRVRTLDRLK